MFARWIRSWGLFGSGHGGLTPSSGGLRPPLALRPLALRRPLVVERLEDRLTPSSLSYEDWRLEQFHVDDQAVELMGPLAAAAQPVNQSFGSLIGLDDAFASYGYRGQGYSVAVIDTGIDFTHPHLGGGWGNRVVAGYDFVNNDNNPMDDNGHGTHVAGIIGSSGSNNSGVAPNVKLIALKVLDAAGSGNFGDVEEALQWVVNHRAQYNIVAVNLSLGTGNYATNPYAFMEDEFQSLRLQGVFVAVAAGNSYYSYSSQAGLAYPAVSPNAVSVGAVWAGNFGSAGWLSGARDHSTAADRVASFSQRSSALDLVAPGAMITSTSKGGGYKAMAGTSMAAPVAAGAAVLVHQALDAAGQSANQDVILDILRSTGASVIDGDDENDNVVNTGLTFKRIDVYAALHSINNGAGTPANAAPVISPISDRTMAIGGSLLVGLSATDANGDPIAFSARVLADAGQAHQLKVQLGLTYLGDYYTNVYGHNEKWLGGSGNQWYCMLPSGELRRWMGTMAATLEPANLVATLDPSYWQDPSLLWNAAPAVTPPVTLQVSGNQLTVQAGPGYAGSFQIEVTASDGAASSKTSFKVTVQQGGGEGAPTLGPIANLSIRRGSKGVVRLVAADPDGDDLSFTAQTLPSGWRAYQLDQQLDLNFKGSYFKNAWGLREKWLATTNPAGAQDWFCILPNGELRRHGGSAAAIMSAGNFIAKLSPAYYRKPQKLWNAQVQSPPQVILRLRGNELAIRPPAHYVGRFDVEAAASDGVHTTRRTFRVRVF